MDSCRVFTYSPINSKANDYYNACKKFDNIRNKMIAYEHKTTDRESSKYQKMLEEFQFWDSKVPETSNIAATEENKLQANMTNPNKPVLGGNLNLLA